MSNPYESNLQYYEPLSLNRWGFFSLYAILTSRLFLYSYKQVLNLPGMPFNCNSHTTGFVSARLPGLRQ